MSKIVLLGFILVLIAAFYIPLKYYGFSDYPVTLSPEPSATRQTGFAGFPIETKVPFLTDMSVKRQFDPSSKFVTAFGKEATPSANYPQEVIKIDDDQLVGMRCTKKFNWSQTDDYTFSTDKESFLLQTSDKTYMDTLEIIKRDMGEGYLIWYFNYCLPDSGGKIIYYKKFSKDSKQKIKSPDNFILVDSADIQKQVRIDTGPVPYFGCQQALEFTRDNILYYRCGGGDIIGWVSIQKIDFNNLQSEKIIDCRLGAEAYDGSPLLVCK